MTTKRTIDVDLPGLGTTRFHFVLDMDGIITQSVSRPLSRSGVRVGHEVVGRCSEADRAAGPAAMRMALNRVMMRMVTGLHEAGISVLVTA